MRHPHCSHVRIINRSKYARKLSWAGVPGMPCWCVNCHCHNVYRRSGKYRRERAIDKGTPRPAPF
jgi:hypothetical protein